MQHLLSGFLEVSAETPIETISGKTGQLNLSLVWFNRDKTPSIGDHCYVHEDLHAG